MPLPGGIHTVHELRNLWDAYSFELQAMNAALAAAWDTWSAADPQGFQAWNADYAKLSAAVADAGATVDTLIASASGSATGEDYTPALDPATMTDYFRTLLRAFATGDPTGPEQPGPGGFDDLDRRFRAGPAKQFAPTYKGIPQPDAPDLQLAAYQLTDTAAKTLEKAGRIGVDLVSLVLAGFGMYLGFRVLTRR